MTTERRIHIDELEYTRQGLRTRESIELVPGEHNRVVLVRPTPIRSVPLGYGGFGHDSAFPTPAILVLALRVALEGLVELFGSKAAGIYQFFGHTSSSGDDHRNKLLSDRRGAALCAFFVGDVGAVRDLAQQEGWGTREHQIMLRLLRCDPGPIDGEPGRLTDAAIEMFQREYNDGVFHRHLEDPTPPTSLAEDGAVSQATLDALLEAYVHATSPRLERERLHPTHPVVGCSEFNRVDTERENHNRRISVVIYDELPPFHDRAPCSRGDEQACPIDEHDERVRCMWYREHVYDPPPAELVHRHVDLRWLELRNGKVLLSALTTLPDESEVTFQVFRTKPIERGIDISSTVLDGPLSEEIPGIVRGGVAQVIWDAPESFELYSTALEPIDLDDLDAARQAPPRARVPTFRVRGGGVVALAPPPGREVGRIPREPSAIDTASDVGFLATDGFGGLFQHSTQPEERSTDERHPLRDAEPRIVQARHSTWKLRGNPS